MRTLTLPDIRLIQNLGTLSVMLGLFGILFAWFPLLGLIALPVSAVGVVLAGSAVGLGWERHVPVGLALLGLVVSLTAVGIGVAAGDLATSYSVSQAVSPQHAAIAPAPTTPAIAPGEGPRGAFR